MFETFTEGRIKFMKHQHPGVTIWFTGLSGAGKTTISRAVYEKRYTFGYKNIEIVYGDVVRQKLTKC